MLELVVLTALLAVFVAIGYFLTGWLFWVVVLGFPAIILGCLQSLFQVDIRRNWLRSGSKPGKDIFWVVAKYLHNKAAKAAPTDNAR